MKKKKKKKKEQTVPRKDNGFSNVTRMVTLVVPRHRKPQVWSPLGLTKSQREENLEIDATSIKRNIKINTCSNIKC